MQVEPHITQSNLLPKHISVAAIDVGFHSTKYSLGRSANNEVISGRFPSLATSVSSSSLQGDSYNDHDGVVVDVGSGVKYFVGKGILGTLRGVGRRAVLNTYCISNEYKAFFLGGLYQIAKHHLAHRHLEIDLLVGGLPLNTLYTHSKHLNQLMKGTHIIPNPVDPRDNITVHVRQALVVAQPHGALFNHDDLTEATPGDFFSVTLDMGGGTFDWFTSVGIRPNRDRSGAVSVGALACAEAVCDEIDPGLRDIPSSWKKWIRLCARNFQRSSFRRAAMKCPGFTGP